METNTELKMIHLSEVESQQIKWLWYPFIPYGKLSIVQGDPGDGKSTLILNIAAKLSIKIHGLRHSHISLLIHMGYSALAIAERVGHEAVDITYHYAHLFPTVQSDMAVHLDSEREELINVRKK